jgi:hypothetical protein
MGNPMHKTGLGILFVVAACACQTGSGTVEPIVIDLSHREPSATPTPSPSPAAVSPIPTPAARAVPTPPPSEVSQTPPAAGPEQVVDRQLDAFNRHDPEALSATFADGATLYDLPDRVRQSGVAEIRKAYALAFANNPALRATISSRILQGRFVVDHKTVSGFANTPPVTEVVIYEVVGGKVQRIWFLK